MTQEAESATLKLPVSEQRDHIQGPATAQVTLVEYGDYQCPDCGNAYPVVKELQQQIGDQFRFVYRNFPLTKVHQYAEHAAEAAEAATAEGKFWEMHDSLFEHQRELADARLVEYATRLGLDRNKFIHAMEDGTFADRVYEDFSSGVRSGVNGTPTFFINGVRHDDAYDVETLRAAIEGARS